MRLFKTFSYLLILMLVLVSACKKKNLQSGELKERSVRYLEKKVAQNTDAPDWLSCRVRIKYEDSNDKQTVVAILKMRKDSLIWASISVPVGLKIEVARVLIAPDSVKVLDKWNKLYYAKEFSFIEQYIDYPLDFATLQHLLWGTPPYEQSYNSVELRDRKYHLKAPDAFLTLGAQNYQILEIIIKDIFTGRVFEASFEDYQAYGDQEFAMERNYQLQTPERYNFDLDFSKVKINEPFSVSWNVSSKYEKVE